jgi:adenylate cyclase
VKLTGILEIGSDPADEADLRVRKRTAVASALVVIAVTLVIASTQLALGLEIAIGLALVQVVAIIAALSVFRRTHRIAHLFVPMAIVGLLVLFLSLVPSGGLNWGADDLVWIILIPLGSVLFLGQRAALPAIGAVIVVVVAAVLVDPLIQEAAPEPSARRLFIAAVNLIGTAVVALALVVFIDGERVRARAESDALLLNVLPRPIADRLRSGERVIADHYDAVTVLFADLVDFTPYAARESPARVVALLNEIFSRFDELAERHGLEKIKTIGDEYMVVAGAPEARPDHAAAVIDMAIAMHLAVGSIDPSWGYEVRVRTGIASGPAVAGVIGRRKFSYDLWGDAVNLASRMESTGVPGMIQIADPTWRLCGDRYPVTPREVDVKGLGSMRTFLLDPLAPGRTGAVPALSDGQSVVCPRTRGEQR